MISINLMVENSWQQEEMFRQEDQLSQNYSQLYIHIFSQWIPEKCKLSPYCFYPMKNILTQILSRLKADFRNRIRLLFSTRKLYS